MERERCGGSRRRELIAWRSRAVVEVGRSSGERLAETGRDSADRGVAEFVVVVQCQGTGLGGVCKKYLTEYVCAVIAVMVSLAV